MRASDPGWRAHRAKWRRVAAFSILEVLVSVTIVSFVAAAGLPQVRKAQRQAKATIIANDLRTFATIFEAYAQERGAWPAETAAGVIPPELAGQLTAGGWQRITPLGGQYNWENGQPHNGTVFKAIVSISETASAPLPIDADMVLEVDRLMDDGNVATGNFRVGVNYDPILILQQ